MAKSFSHRAAHVFLFLLVILAVFSSGARLEAASVPPAPGDPGPLVEAAPAAAPAAPAWSNGPDEFGYQLYDGLFSPSQWIDATAGVNTGMTGAYQQVGPLPLPFPFKFYENAYDQVYISTNGTIGFSGKLTSQSQVYSFPQIQEPNNVIAANWAPENASTGGVYYHSGGTTPDRWFAVEWHQVRDTNPDSRLTFEILLHESGNIEFLYQVINYGADNSRYTPGVGIEDSRGRDGLYYNADYLRNNRVVYIMRPAPSARVSIWPRSGQGALAPPQTAADCTWTVSNNGEFGADRYDVVASSGWPTQVLGPDGVTPLTDTDGDGAVDTGPLAMGASTQVHVKLSVPPGAQVGDHDSAVVMFRSAVDAARARATQCQAAVAAPFAQAYGLAANAATRLLRFQHPSGSGEVTVKGYEMQWGQPATVEETPSHIFLHAWSTGQYVTGRNIWINEIEYAVLDQYGDVLRPVTKLTDHSADTASIYDRYQQVAVAPNGRMAVVWQRRELNASSGQPRVNLQLANLDSAGAPLFGPADLTNVKAWGSGNLPGVPSFETPQIAATDDNRFVVAWNQTEQTASGTVSDIYLAVVDTAGASVRGATRITGDAPGSADGSGFWSPGLAAMDGNAVLLTWVARSTGNLSYAVISSAGDTVRAAAALTTDGTISQPNSQADAARVSGGNVVLAWSKGRDRDSVARVAVLDPNGAILTAPFTLTNPAGPQGNTALSVARAGDKAVLTWRDGYYNYRFRLFYALLSGQGDILTPPMIFRSSEGEDSFLEPGNNASYGFTPPSGVDTVLRVSPALNVVRPGQKVTLTITYGNHAADLAQGVQLTATLGPSLTYLGDSLGRPATAQAQASAGGQVVWQLPSLAFLNRGSFEIYLQVAPDATPETISQVSLALTSQSVDINPGDNEVTSKVEVGKRTFLPLISK